MADLNKNPDSYVIGCAAAAEITVKGGSQSDVKDAFGADDHDWVPGESGFIENTEWDQSKGIAIMGENIIYTGARIFWGHTPDLNPYRTFNQWMEFVKSWGKPRLTSRRTYPITGIKV